MLGTGEEEGDEARAQTGDGLVTVEWVFLQLRGDGLLHCGLEEAELCGKGMGGKNIRW